MAKHEVVIHENKGATKGVAPYTGVYIAKETVRQDGFMGYIATKSGLPAVQAQAILEGAFEAVEELEKESLVRIHTDLGTICGIITGSFETADAAFDPEKNSLELALRLEDAIRLSLADVVPTIIADENLTKVRVDNVMDLVTPRPYNLIHGQNVYRVAGFNMVHEDEGATVFLQDAKGVTYEVVVDRVVSKQLFEAHTAELLEAGDYKLVVKSRAGDAEGPLQTAFRRVKYLKVGEPIDPTAPHLTGYKVGVETVTKIPAGASFTVLGERIEAFNCETGTSKAMMTFTAGARAGTTMDLGYTGISWSPRYDADFGGVYIATPNVELAAGEKGTITLEIDGKKSNALAFEVE